MAPLNYPSEAFCDDPRAHFASAAAQILSNKHSANSHRANGFGPSVDARVMLARMVRGEGTGYGTKPFWRSRPCCPLSEADLRRYVDPRVEMYPFRGYIRPEFATA